MAIILKGPIDLAGVANLLSSLTHAFYANKGYRGDVKAIFWESEHIVAPINLELPDEARLPACYNEVYSRGRLPALASVAGQFAVGVNLIRDGSMKVKTRAFNKTLLEDVVKGQTIPSPVGEFVIASYRFEDWSLFDEFVQYRNQMVFEAQRRLGASVSMAAYHMINDLHP